jgi:hypothetical protein
MMLPCCNRAIYTARTSDGLLIAALAMVFDMNYEQVSKVIPLAAKADI